MMRPLVLGVTALFCLLLPSPVFANARAKTEGGRLFVNGIAVLEVRSGARDFTRSQRSQLAAGAIESADETAPVSIRRQGKEYEIRIGEVPCLTVTRFDARAYKVTPAELARSWASKLSGALSLPPVKALSTTLQMPIGGAKSVVLVGAQAPFAVIKASSDIVSVTRTEDGIQVKGVGTGAATVTLEAGPMVESISVNVLPYAAKFPQSLYAEVAGYPAAASSVAGAVESALRSQLKGLPMVVMGFTVPEGRQIPAGEAKTFSVRVRATSPGSYPVVGTANVTVRNLIVPRKPDAELYYSNNPEIVTRAQSLFSARLQPDTPARLLYHHINGTNYPMYLRVQAVNESDEPIKVIMMPGDSPPDRNPVLAGLLAADQYFRIWTMSSGEVLTIPPRSTLPISLRRLGPGETGSGLCGLRIIDGKSPLLIRTDSWPPFDLNPKWASAVASSAPWRFVGCPAMTDFDRAPYNLSEHVYPNPQKMEEVRYEVGGRYGFVRIGQRAILRQDANSQLDGNFGVIYNIKGQVQNPTTTPTEIEVVFEASAGYSGGIFMVDGIVVRTNLLQPKTESRIAKFRVGPGETRKLNIWTIPLSGSSYPATLTIRPLLNFDPPTARTVKK